MKAVVRASSTTAKRLRIVIADDHALTRHSLFSIISQSRRSCELVGEANSAAEAISVCQRFTPDLLLLDVDMPGHSAIGIVPELKRNAPATRVLLYCAAVKETDILAAMHAGADGFLEKTCSREDFLEAIDKVADGHTYLCSKTTSALARSLRGSSMKTGGGGNRHPELTPREKQILALIVEGASSKEIAKKLFLSISTVETHRANLMTKIGARNVAQLIHYAVRHRLVNLPELSRL